MFISIGIFAVTIYIGYVFFVTYSEKNMLTLLNESYTNFTVKDYIEGEASYFRNVSTGNESANLQLTSANIQCIMDAMSSTKVEGIFAYEDIQMDNHFAIYLEPVIPDEDMIRLYVGKDRQTNTLLLTISSTKKTVAYYYKVQNDSLYNTLECLAKAKQAH